jgi:hypothetical protein
MNRLIAVPDPRNFSILVEQYEGEYNGLDQTYQAALEDFKGKDISTLSYYEVESIFHPYLLKWGKMGRARVFIRKACFGRALR